MTTFFDLAVEYARTYKPLRGWLLRAPWGSYLEQNPATGQLSFSALVEHATVLTGPQADELLRHYPDTTFVADPLGRVPNLQLDEKGNL